MARDPIVPRSRAYAWIVFLMISLVIFLFGLTDIPTAGSTFGEAEAPTFERITGTTWDATKDSPSAAHIDWMVRSQAIWMMLAGALSAFISITAFRRAERWAWLAMTFWPVAIAAIDINLFLSTKYWTATVPPPLISGAVLLGVSLLTLALSFRSAFRRTALRS